jgi:hypothetical protein
VDPTLPPEATTAAVTPGPTSDTPSTSPDTSGQTTGDPEQLASDFKKPELQAAAAVLGADVPASATKADIAQAIVDTSAASTAAPTLPPSQTVGVNNYNRRSGEDAILGTWVDVVSGEHQGRFGAYEDTSTWGDDGYPDEVLIRSRDSRNELLLVKYSDVRPSERNGGR